MVLLCCLQHGLVHHGLQSEKLSHLSLGVGDAVALAPQMEAVAQTINPVAVPGVDGRWQEELVKGECHSEPAPLRVTAITREQISTLSLTGNSYGVDSNFLGKST